MQTPNYPENVAAENSPESLVVRFAEPVGTEADSCDSHKHPVNDHFVHAQIQETRADRLQGRWGRQSNVRTADRHGLTWMTKSACNGPTDRLKVAFTHEFRPMNLVDLFTMNPPFTEASSFARTKRLLCNLNSLDCPLRG
jgi:hypothetical protein